LSLSAFASLRHERRLEVFGSTNGIIAAFVSLKMSMTEDGNHCAVVGSAKPTKDARPIRQP